MSVDIASIIYRAAHRCLRTSLDEWKNRLKSLGELNIALKIFLLAGLTIPGAYIYTELLFSLPLPLNMICAYTPVFAFVLVRCLRDEGERDYWENRWR